MGGKRGLGGLREEGGAEERGALVMREEKREGQKRDGALEEKREGHWWHERSMRGEEGEGQKREGPWWYEEKREGLSTYVGLDAHTALSVVSLVFRVLSVVTSIYVVQQCLM